MSRLLNQVVKRARKSPFYSAVLPETNDFELMPITTKAHLRSGYPFGFLATDKKTIATYHESSGTEGKPISSYFSENDWSDIACRFARGAVDLSSKDTFFIKTPYSMVTTAHQAQKAAEMVGALVVPGDNRTSNMPYSRVVQLLKDLDVTVTWSLPTEVLLWALAAEKAGLNPKTDFPSLRAFWVAGEALSPAKKLLLQKIWGGKQIFEDYGSTETGSLAGECAEGKMHAWSDRIHFEIYDEATGNTSAFGKGQLLVTPLYREAMPLIRYLIEDEVELEQECCRCGSKFPVIRILGRRSSFVQTQGKNVLPKEIEDNVIEAGLPFEMSLWRGYYDKQSLDIEFTAAKNAEACAVAISQRLENVLGIQSRVTALPMESFVPPKFFKEKLKFAKPRALFPRGEYSGRSVQYY